MSALAFVRGSKMFVFGSSKITARDPAGSLSTLATAALSLNSLLRSSQPHRSPPTIELRPKIGHRQCKGIKPVYNTPSPLSYRTHAAINSACVFNRKWPFSFAFEIALYTCTRKTRTSYPCCVSHGPSRWFFLQPENFIDTYGFA